MQESKTNQQKPQTTQSKSYLEGITDGSHGYPLQIKRMHDFEYMRGYVEGITKWRDGLFQREQENLEASGLLEF